MLREVFKYSGSFAKVKAMRGRLLNNDDYEALLAKSSVGGVAQYLRSSKGYRDILPDGAEGEIHRGQLEQLLQNEKEREFAKLFKFEKGRNKNFLHIFILRYEIELLKEMLRLQKGMTLFTLEGGPNGYYKKHMTINVEKLAASESRQQFIENLKGSEYYKILSRFLTDKERLNIFNIEMTLDVYYFSKAWRLLETLLEKSDKPLVEESLGQETDILNVLWIYRCKKYFDPPGELLYSFIIPKGYKLKGNQLAALIEAKSVDELMALISKTPYAKIFEKNDIFTEQHYYKYIMSVLRKAARRKPFSIMSTLLYIHEKDAEVSNIVKIVEGIRYKLDLDEIRRYLIQKSDAGNIML